MKIVKIVFLLMITGGLVNNQRLNYPIIWRKSNHDIATQLIEADIVIRLESPCDILSQLKKTNDSNIIKHFTDQEKKCMGSYVKHVAIKLRLLP